MVKVGLSKGHTRVPHNDYDYGCHMCDLLKPNPLSLSTAAMGKKS